VKRLERVLVVHVLVGDHAARVGGDDNVVCSVSAGSQSRHNTAISVAGLSCPVLSCPVLPQSATAQLSTAQRSTAQHSTAQHSPSKDSATDV
jgi:hypothetical protein